VGRASSTPPRYRYKRIAPSDASPAPDQPALTLARWELVAGAGDDALLRLAGRWHPAPPEHVELVRCSADAIDAVAPLHPGPVTASDGTWSVAFAVDAAASSERLVLWSGAGLGVALPAPARPATPLVAKLQEEQAAERAQREIAKLREQLAEARAAAEAEPESEHLAETAGAADPEPDPPRRLLGRRAPKVSPNEHRDVLGRLEEAQAERAKLEDEAAHLSDHKRQLEQELEQAATIEADLRHLLDARERELTQLRSELAEQRARFAAVAGRPHDPRSDDAPEDADRPTAQPHGEKPWTGADQELLERIARAKALAGQ
jgi:hypothetical protein